MFMRRGSSLAVVVALAGGAVSADDAVVGGAMLVRTHDGERLFTITDRFAETTEAAPAELGRIDKPGAPRLDAFTLTNRVVVRAANVDAIRELERAGLGYESRAIAALPGYYIVSGLTVDDAIWAAGVLGNDQRIDEAYVDAWWPRTLRALPTDPGFESQWYLHNTLVPVHDSNVEPVWTAGYTGAGVTVGVLEGGWQVDHQDLVANYNDAASQTTVFVTSHGTGVAGVVGMAANNGIGGAGTAYGAQISRLIYGGATGNADAFMYRNDLNDIKNNSWGPSDNGTLHTISSVELAALADAVATGRGGLGEVFTWAAGNGGTNDRVDYDPYASSRYVISVGGIGDGDIRSSFNELGSAHMVVAHTAGNSRSVYTTTTNNGYTQSFGGTSAASPHGAGVVALMLEANPKLTWRDVQHILMTTARKNDPANPGWTTNGAGHDISYDYGYGAIDAEAAVNAALVWQTVTPEVSAAKTIVVDQPIPDNDPTGITAELCLKQSIDVESVELIINATSTYVGDLRITLTSPRGTESVLTTPRSDSRTDLVDYRFTTRRLFGEWGSGTWTVQIADEADQDLAFWQDATIVVHGTQGPIACTSVDLTTQGAGEGTPQFGVPDGQITGADINYYVNQWLALKLCVADVTTQGAPEGDPDYGVPDGKVTGIDLQYFVNLWIVGCP